jgi:hypothetical protein
VQEPAAPQWAWLLLGSTHAPLHSTRGGAHDVVQLPLEQTSPPGQLEPHAVHEFVAVM